MNYNNLCINCMQEKNPGSSVCPHCGFDAGTYTYPPHVLPPLTPLNGKYIIGRMLGAGGFGITYLALDTALERPVAVKEFFVQRSMYRHTTMATEITISASTEGERKVYEVNRVKFEQEAKTLAKLTNLPGVVRVYDFFKENNTLYMVLDYLPGVTLKEYVVRRGGRLPFDEVVHKLTSVMTSLDQLHNTVLVSPTEQRTPASTQKRGIIHRDISPDNIMVAPNGTLTLFDFGGAKIRHDEQSSVILAKRGYTPVEQLQSSEEPGPWMDVYALAATIYYCLCGEAPIEAPERVLYEDPLVRPSARGVQITPEQEAVLLKGLAVLHKNRYQTMAEFRDALVKSLGGGSSAGGGPQFGRGQSSGANASYGGSPAYGRNPSYSDNPTYGRGPSSMGSMSGGSLSGAGERPRKWNPLMLVIPAAVIALIGVGVLAVNILKRDGSEGSSVSTVQVEPEKSERKTEKLTEKPETEKPTEEPQTQKRETEKPAEETQPQTVQKKAAGDIVSSYNKGVLSYGEASAQIADSDDPTGGLAQLDRLKASKDAYESGNLVSATDAAQALSWYGQVIAEDVNYADAQEQIGNIQSREVTACQNDVNALLAGGQYVPAIQRVDAGLAVAVGNGELVALRQQCLSQYSAYAISSADIYAAARDFEGARAVLSEAYSVTEDGALIQKITEIDQLAAASAGDTSFYLDGRAVPTGSYILPDSASRYLTESDVKQLTWKGIRYAINEIYARRGYKFTKKKELKKYFKQQPWYSADTADQTQVRARMNSYETANIDLLVKLETELWGGEYELD